MRGQISLEVVILFGFMVLIFIGFLGVVQSRIQEQHQLRQQDLYAQLADKVEREVMLADRVYAGYARSFDLPLTLAGEPYDLVLEGKGTLVIKGNFSDREYLRFLRVNVTGIAPWPLPSDPYAIVSSASHTVIIAKNASGLFFRGDCVADGRNASACA